MHNNIGQKIQTLAKVIMWIGIVTSIGMGVVIMANTYTYTYGTMYSGVGNGVVAGIFVMIAGVISSWVGSFLLYGFGQLIINTDSLRNK